MVRKAKTPLSKKREEAKIKKIRLSFQLKKAELFETEIILDDAIEDFNQRFDTGREPKKIIEPMAQCDSTEMMKGQERGHRAEKEIPKIEKEIWDNEEEIFGRDKDLRELFKKIAIKTHPDKLKDVDGSEREYKINLYKEAANAVKSGDGASLLEIAYELSVQFKVDKDKEISWLNRKNKELDQSILNIKQTAEWIWFHSSGLNREIVEKRITDQLGFKLKAVIAHSP